MKQLHIEFVESAQPLPRQKGKMPRSWPPTRSDVIAARSLPLRLEVIPLEGQMLLKNTGYWDEDRPGFAGGGDQGPDANCANLRELTESCFFVRDNSRNSRLVPGLSASICVHLLFRANK